MNFSQIFRWFTAVVLTLFTWSILLDRWAWHKVPTQMSPISVYVIIALNLAAVLLLVVAPSALGLSTKTDKN